MVTMDSGTTCDYNADDWCHLDQPHACSEEVEKVLAAINYAWVVALLGFYWHKIFYKSQTRRMRPEGYPSGFT